MSKILPGVGLLTKEQLRVAKKAFGYRWREEKRRQRRDGKNGFNGPQEAVFGNDTYITEARDWWLIAFAHGVEYARVLKAKELFK